MEEAQEEEVSRPKLAKPSGKPKIEAWYVNLKKSKDRNKCISQQLEDLGFEPYRFEAVEWPKTCSGNTACLRQKTDVADCITGGVGWGAVTVHGTKNKNSEARVQRGVLANWCSHKRLLEQYEMNKTNTKEEEYIVVFEDDVILHKDFKDRIEKFIMEYDGKLNDGKVMDWDFVQIDPFGSTGKQM